jgi:hypothetical protein
VTSISVVNTTVSDAASNGDATTESVASLEDRMASRPQTTRKHRKASSKKSRQVTARKVTHKAVRKRTRTSNKVSKPPNKVSAPRASKVNVMSSEMKGAIAFRLSKADDNLLKAKQKEMKDEKGHKASRSLVVRSMLVTHMLIGNDGISAVKFIGNYRAYQEDGEWRVVNKDDETLHAYRARQTENGWTVVDRQVDEDSPVPHMGRNVNAMTREEAMAMKRDVAIMRAEWLAQVATGNVGPDDPDGDLKRETKALRLPRDQRVALERLKALNNTTMSVVLRSFLTTHLVDRRNRLLEISFGKSSLRAYPNPSGWCIDDGDKRVACDLTLQDVFERVEWMLQTRVNAA